MAELRLEHPELFKAPTVDPWPPDISDPLMSPADVICTEKNGAELSGVFVPQDLWAVLDARDMELEQFPGRAQAAIDALVVALDGKPSVTEAAGDLGAANAQPPPGYSLKAVLSAGLVGTAIGIIVGSVLR